MNTLRRIIPALAVGVLLAGLGSAPVSAQDKVKIAVATNPSTTSQYLWAAQHMGAVAKITGYDITVQESGGTDENMYRIEKQKTAQFGMIDPVLIAEKFPDGHGIRHFANYSPSVWQIFVAADANIKTLKDLEGKKFNPGPTGGGSAKITVAILDKLGIKPDYFDGTLNDALDAYADGQIVGLSYRGTGTSATSGVLEAAAGRPVTFVPFTAEEITVAKGLYPFLGESKIVANTYAGQTEDVPTIASWQGEMGVSKDVDNDVVYNMVKAYFETLPEVAKTHKSLGLVTEENSLTEAGLPLHAGVIRYYREKGYTIPDALIPPEAR